MSKDELHPAFRKKIVYNLDCNACGMTLCRRGMRAFLLSDTKIKLFSTDIPEFGAVEVVPQMLLVEKCACKQQDVACLGCGNVVGYHVALPCRKCLVSCNNGHLWMFESQSVSSIERFDSDDEGFLVWGNLKSVEDDSVFNIEECIR
ncbi:protein FAM72A [Patella vulgata]|uniref:protein FAM72A n=1 Tax=Patella vulgata TaxID=6465 RepID=UPI00217F3082|nr:protein FAM72A [Patella vulgata]